MSDDETPSGYTVEASRGSTRTHVRVRFDGRQIAYGEIGDGWLTTWRTERWVRKQISKHQALVRRGWAKD